MFRFFVWNRRYSKMKQEQDKSIRTVKSISNNVLEVEVYYSSFQPTVRHARRTSKGTSFFQLAPSFLSSKFYLRLSHE
ncbi:Uncharacterised protein [Streptococcus pneumoniae]|nr:Uncharacterised protein [Streptococcus pneumoniae]